LYFQGLLAMAGLIREPSRFFSPIGASRVTAVDVRDIAAVAATAITEPGHIGETYTITGPAAVTHREITEAISAVVGREVVFVDVTRDAFASSLRGLLPAVRLTGCSRTTRTTPEVTLTVADVTGRAPRTVAEFARDHADAFR
jgi:uncharacterized protein YbjT (DUF2867 family)